MKRTNRLFNFLNPKFYRMLLLLLAFFVIGGLCMLPSKEDPWFVYPLSAATVTLIYCIIRFLHFPKDVTLEAGKLRFCDYVDVSHRWGGKRRFHWVKVEYTVWDIHDLAFHQTAIERRFDVGHISFSGRCEFRAARDIELIEAPEKFAIYGIRDFSAFEYELLQAMQKRQSEKSPTE